MVRSRPTPIRQDVRFPLDDGALGGGTHNICSISAYASPGEAVRLADLG
jgi:hypothetical protein